VYVKLARVERKRRVSAADLDAACARGRAGNPGLSVDDATFVEHLERAVAAADRKAGADGPLSELAIEDLFLACACLVQAPGAAVEVDRRHGETMRAAVARLVPGPDGAEVVQQLFDTLLVGSPETPPKIGSYAGQAPLDRWLQVTAQRAALTWLRSRQAEARAYAGAAAQPQAAPAHPEMAYLKERYRADFEKALQEALERMPARDRALLRLHLVGGMTVESVGRMFGIAQTTASRQLAKARTALLKDLKKTLRQRIGASSAEVASLAALVASELDVSLSQLLKAG
jgi:RNA polymerase sigma-70 factor, ECF subfamily